jgi:thioredoxin-dependent peroxiredoxin
MKNTGRNLGIALALAAVLSAAGARAALQVGDAAPAFVAEAALGGKAFTFDLAQALKKGPVVLYFYPKAFTSNCTVEAPLDLS